MPYPKAGVETEAYVPRQLRQGPFPIVTQPAVLVSGQNLADNAVLGIISASGKYTLCNSGASDGSQFPAAILANATNASAGDVTTSIYVSGEFNVDELVFHASFSTLALKMAAFAPTATIKLKDPLFSANS